MAAAGSIPALPSAPTTALGLNGGLLTMDRYRDETATEQGSAETNDADNETSMNYDFIQTGTDSTEPDYDSVGSMWTLGDHGTLQGEDRASLMDSIGNAMMAMDDDLDDDLLAVLQDAGNLVKDTSVNSFECPVEACGLGHSHPDHKHDIRAGFEVTEAFAEQMDFCPYCHCGVNELAMLMNYFGYISVPVFENQHEFEGMLEMDPVVLNNAYGRYDGGAEMGVTGVPIDLMDEARQFFALRERIESAADSAPIASETRQAITENRELLAEVTSE